MDLLKILDGTPEPPVIDLQLERINDSGDYLLATPMYEFQKELTDQIVSLHYPDILKYCETNDSKALIVKSLEICINNCMLVSTHPYLLINHYMPKNLLMKDMPNKLADTSGKFNVLRDLMNVIILSNTSLPGLKYTTKNIAIVMKNDVRFFDLVEALLLGCSGNKVIKRYVGQNVQRESKKTSTNKESKGKANSAANSSSTSESAPTKKTRSSANGKAVQPLTTIHLLPYDGELKKDQDSLKSVKFDSLVIFDGYVDVAGDFVQQIRSQHRSTQAILIRLIPVKTIEHCKAFYENDTSSSDYLYKLISSIVCSREFIGNLSPDIFPIYNQRLTYLGAKFFNHLWSLSKYPSWPLPELPKIPQYNANDVERSLLTEVHFHYTPYDSTDLAVGDSDKPTELKKRSYYEMKRLELDYSANPLKNDYNDLVGVHSNASISNVDSHSKILTHKLIMSLNNVFLDLKQLNGEHASYLKFSSRHDKIGRETDLNKVKSIHDDVDHTETRISIAKKLSEKKTAEIEKTQEESKEYEAKIKSFVQDNQLEESKLGYYHNQVEIWDLQSQIKTHLQRIKSKNEEKNYMFREYENCLKSIDESQTQIKIMETNIASELEKTEQAIADEQKHTKTFIIDKQRVVNELNKEKSRNEALKVKLSSSLKFLKDTAHLKKRKGRAFTPSKGG